MKTTVTHIVFQTFICLLPQLTHAQIVPSDLAIPIRVTTSKNPVSIRLDWKLGTPRNLPIWVQRKQANDTIWQMLAVLESTDTTYTDTNVKIGEAWEYNVRSLDLPIPSYWWRWMNGLVYAGIEVPPVTSSRGRLLLIWDATLSDPLANELAAYEQNLRGDGWQLVRRDIDPATATVPLVKSLIREFYLEDSLASRTVLLFGEIPVPYSGFTNPDGHQDHRGAWPADCYYGDMDDYLWSDTTDYWPVYTPRAANINDPGDGKFDQDYKPSPLELSIGRVDFSNLHGWEVSQTELYRRYLNKNLNFRSGAYRPPNKTIVDDHFGFVYQVGFSVNGFRNGHSLTGPTNNRVAPWFQDTERDSFLVGYACGGGSYTSADGVGESSQFISDTINVVFSMLFGSYFGDWDYENNPFMPSALASKGGILTCFWAGFPTWHLHHMALGMPVTFSNQWVDRNAHLQQENFVYSPGPYYNSIHISLLGDPSLRLHYPVPPRDPAAIATCSDIRLQWTPSPEATHGYMIYRSATADGLFELITSDAVTDTFFVDAAPLNGSNFYQIKTLKLEHPPTGSYFNQSIGVPVTAFFSATALTLSGAITPANCHGGQTGAITLDVSGNPTGLSFSWSNGASTQNLDGLEAGDYTVTVTIPGLCSQTKTFQVSEPDQALALQTDVSDPVCPGATNGYFSAMASGGTPGYTYLWSNGPAGVTEQNDAQAGTYGVTVTDQAGCTATATVILEEYPVIQLQVTAVNPRCHGNQDGAIYLSPSGTGLSFAWSNGSAESSQTLLPAGAYSVTVTDGNGCTESTGIELTAPPLIDLTWTVKSPSCSGFSDGAIQIFASGGSGGYQYEWMDIAANSPELTQVKRDTYYVTVTDNAFCAAVFSIPVSEPEPLTVLSEVHLESCALTANGTISLTISGGSPDYHILWSSGDTSQTTTIDAAGSYGFTVTDAHGCDSSNSIEITAPTPIEIGVATMAPACPGNADGSATVTVSGGSGSFSYAWSSGANTATASGLTAGAFVVTVTDTSNGCSATAEALLQTDTLPQVLITGPDSVCVSQPMWYYLNGGMAGEISWSLSNGGLIINGGNQPAVQVVWSETGQFMLTAAFEHSNGCRDTSVAMVSVGVCSGVLNLDSGLVTAFPNPFKYFIDIRINEFTGGNPVARLYDAQGKLMVETGLTGPSLRIDTEYLPAGLYFLKVSGAAGAGAWRMLKTE